MKDFNWKDFALICLVFVIALSVRSYHHSHLESEITTYYLGSDSAEYYHGALNLLHHRTFSIAKPTNLPPKPDAIRAPGYPIFLVPFIYVHKSLDKIWLNVISFQAFLGSLIAIMSFILARSVLNRVWAIIAGFLTALSPHLIASEIFLVTETLYTFFLVLANLLFCLFLEKRKFSTLFFLGIALGISILIRPIGILLGLFFVAILIMDNESGKFLSANIVAKRILIFSLGFFLSIGPFFIRNYIVLGQTFPESNRGWESIVDGSYINFTNKDLAFYGVPYRDDPENNLMKNDKKYFFKTMRDRIVSQPIPYLKWYLVDKILSSWEWDIAVNSGWGNVYIYRLKMHGFYEYKILSYIYNFSKLLHKPLVWLCFLTFPFLMLYYCKNKILPKQYVNLLPLLATVVYFNLLMIVIFPLPRYTLPLRPFCYILAITNIALLINYFSPNIPVLANRIPLKGKSKS
jgi:4-amino-4-deoxy-L-arabinose transferase-like glycosyltransferase